MKKLLIPIFALAALPFAAFAQTETQALNDAEIIGIVMTVNQAEINAGELAQSVSSHPDVKMFGQQLSSEHNESNSLFIDLANKQDISPQSSSISDNLKAEEEKHLENLKKLHGILFDLSYANHELESHQKVLDMWDKQLIPNASNEELKSLLVSTRKSIADHLEQAKLIKKSLGRKK